MSKAVYKFYWYGRRGYTVDGLFVEHKEYVDQLIGQDVYFGEIRGKHSEVYGILDKEDIEMLTDDESIVKFFEDNKVHSGHNPVEYILDSAEYENGKWILDDGTEIKDLDE